MKNTGMAAPTPMLIGGGRDHTKAPCRAVAATPIPPYFIFSNNYSFFCWNTHSAYQTKPYRRETNVIATTAFVLSTYLDSILVV